MSRVHSIFFFGNPIALAITHIMSVHLLMLHMPAEELKSLFAEVSWGLGECLA